MKIVLAQGNPGPSYTQTRHNISWIILDAYAASHSVAFKYEKKFMAEIATLSTEDDKVLLVKPTTFYNETGRTARALIDFYKLTPSNDLLVLHDDLSLPFGTVRVRDTGSDAGNKGIRSISSHVGSSYWRLRIGIHDETYHPESSADFVLSRLSAASIKHTKEKITPAIATMIEKFQSHTLNPTSVQTLE